MTTEITDEEIIKSVGEDGLEEICGPGTRTRTDKWIIIQIRKAQELKRQLCAVQAKIEELKTELEARNGEKELLEQEINHIYEATDVTVDSKFEDVIARKKTQKIKEEAVEIR